MKLSKVLRRRLVLLSVLGIPSLIFGQGVPVLKSGNFEVGVDGGFTFGGGVGALNTQINGQGYATPSSNGVLGVHVGLAASRNVVLYGEWAYLAGSRLQATQDVIYLGGANNRGSADGHLSGIDANGGLEFRFQSKASPKVVPYVGLGAGIIRDTAGLQQSLIGTSTYQSFSRSISQVAVIGNGGFGLRYFFTEHAGLRFDVKGYAGQDNVRFGRLAFGLFYQFH